MIEELQPQTLQAWIAEKRAFRLIDVREQEEWQLARLAGAELKPLSELPTWLEELASASAALPLVIYCHHGIRSARVCTILATHRTDRLCNLAGGIDRWSREIDPAIPCY